MIATWIRSSLKKLMPNLPPPPVPERLREMLKDYPELIQRVQEELDYCVTHLGKGIPAFEQAVWALEGVIGSFVDDAQDELAAAETSGDSRAIELAKRKRSAFRRILFDRPWNEVGEDQRLWTYFETHEGAFR